MHAESLISVMLRTVCCVFVAFDRIKNNAKKDTVHFRTKNPAAFILNVAPYFPP